MVSKESRQEIRVKKHMKIRNRFAGTAERPRLAVFRSNNHMYAQIIDDTVGKTLVSASTVEKDVKAELKKTNDVEAAAYLGTVIAKRAIEKGITTVVFDRGGFIYQGKVAALAAQKFKNIDEMHKVEGKLGSEDEFNKSADKAKEIGDKYRAEIGKYGKHSSDSLFDLFDEAMESLAKASDSKGYTTVAKLRAVLKKTDAFRDDIPDDVLQLGVDYLKALTDTTTQYFEAKPQRAIDISEFAGAVVPANGSGTHWHHQIGAFAWSHQKSRGRDASTDF